MAPAASKEPGVAPGATGARDDADGRLGQADTVATISQQTEYLVVKVHGNYGPYLF